MECRKLRPHPNTKSNQSQFAHHRRRLKGCKKYLDLRAELFRFGRTPQAGPLPRRLKYIACSYPENTWDTLSCKIVKPRTPCSAIGPPGGCEGRAALQVSIDQRCHGLLPLLADSL